MKHRFATENDLDLLAEWNHQLTLGEGDRNLMTIRQLRDRIQGWLAGKYKPVLFNEAADPVAYALYQEDAAEIYLRQLFVKRGYRRQGIGREVMNILEKEIWPSAKRQTVEVLTANVSTVAFWRCVGYSDYCLTLERTRAGSEAANNRFCSNWAEVRECLGDFSPPETSIHDDGSVAKKGWVFRGLTRSSYELQPSIEREAQAKSMDWAALEELVLSEFKARARMHLSAPLIPEDKLTWLAQMQHYGIPTRLLDFTYSPFVALYFAIRNGCKSSRGPHLRLWAVDAEAVNNRFRKVALAARAKARQRDGTLPRLTASLNPDDSASDRDSLITETQGLNTLISESLSATGTRRKELERSGCICAALPPGLNPRLASQQGVFLLNCAEGRNFKESLTKMMEPCSDWCKTFDFPVGLISEIEGHLFKMNIHEQSLFPDLEGLAGLIRQNIRLHWK